VARLTCCDYLDRRHVLSRRLNSVSGLKDNSGFGYMDCGLTANLYVHLKGSIRKLDRPCSLRERSYVSYL